MKREKNEYSGSDPIKDIDYIGNAIKLGVRGFVRICIETCARGNVIGNTDSEKRAC